MPPSSDRRQALLVEGRRLFLAQGYTATSVDAICQAAGVTKGAFFHHFRSKEEFASAVLAFTWQPVVEAHDDQRIDTTAVDHLAWHISFMVEWICESGRLMPMLAQELGSLNPEIRDQVAGYFATWMGYLDDVLAAATKDAKSEVDIAALKEFIVATTEGAPVVSNQFGPQALNSVSRHLVAAVGHAINQ